MSGGRSNDEVMRRFRAVRERTDRLAAVLSAEDQVVQSMPDTSPTKWHRAHTTWFFAEFVLGADGTSGRPWDRPEYRFLYNSYYEAVGARHPRPERGLVTRPSIAEVAKYREYVDHDMAQLMAPGVSPEVGLGRIYPLDQDFAHVVGYVGPVSDFDLSQMRGQRGLVELRTKLRACARWTRTNPMNMSARLKCLKCPRLQLPKRRPRGTN